MPPRLILNADDFGLTAGINRAVEELHQAHALTSATLMATGPAFEDAVRVALRNPSLGVGCHLVFIDGVPVSHPESIPTLLGSDGKTFRSSNLDFMQALLRGTIRAADLARETQAQIQKLQRAGVDVTHIDSHKHTHLFPAVARPILHAAERCGVCAFRYPNEPRWSRKLSTTTPWTRRAAQSALDFFEPRFRALVDFNTDERTTSGTLGIAATGTLNATILRQMISELTQQGDQAYELCCHPGYNDADLDLQNTRLRQTREIEYNALLEVIPEISRVVGSPELIHYGNLGVPGLQRASHRFTPFTGYEKVL
jgi:chitin disaccharide deacetylase